jgi:hypothetical protein
MSQRNRITCAAIALVATLFLAAPAPTFAAWLPEGRIPLTHAWERAWSWLGSLVLPGAGVSPGLKARWENEGSMINPDGRTTPAAPAPAPLVTLSAPKPAGIQ